MVKTASSNVGCVGSVSGWGAKILHVVAKKTKETQSRSDIVTDSTKTLKVVHIKKKKSLKKSQIFLNLSYFVHLELRFFKDRDLIF